MHTNRAGEPPAPYGESLILCHSPVTAVPSEGIVTIQAIGAVVGKTKDSACGQNVVLTGLKRFVEMEGQNDDVVHVIHLDPTHLLIQVAGLVDADWC